MRECFKNLPEHACKSTRCSSFEGSPSVLPSARVEHTRPHPAPEKANVFKSSVC